MSVCGGLRVNDTHRRDTDEHDGKDDSQLKECLLETSSRSKRAAAASSAAAKCRADVSSPCLQQDDGDQDDRDEHLREVEKVTEVHVFAPRWLDDSHLLRLRFSFLPIALDLR